MSFDLESKALEPLALMICRLGRDRSPLQFSEHIAIAVPTVSEEEGIIIPISDTS